MTADDIVFADFGPVFDDWEGEFGRTWVLGNDPEKLRLRDDLPTVFGAGKQYFESHPDITGEELYSEMVRLTKPMRRTDPTGRIGHWILEVHLVDREREIGGFYEELLTLTS